MKKFLYVLLAVTLLLICTKGCAKKQPKYQCGTTATEEEVLSIFHEQKETMKTIAEILHYNENNFYYDNREPGGTKAWIMSPYDEKKMSYFNEEDRQIITNFIETTKPYMIVIYGNHASFDYINSEQLTSYSIDYYMEYSIEPSRFEKDVAKYRDGGDLRWLIESADDGWMVTVHTCE